jgi:predicted Zn finger-like uncharacterized protein
MSMVTRCPGCATAFRVQPGQLSARNGQVRCGKCNTVFDGVVALVKDSREALPPPSAEKADEEAPETNQEPLPAFMAEPPRPRRALWWSLIGLAALVLALQAAYHFRAELAARWPQTRGALEAGCRLLECELRLPRQARLLSIDSYEVRPDPRREGVIVLNAVIRNRAPFRQEYPALQLTLTDEANRELVSRAILPREYLEVSRAAELIARGIDAGGEAALTVHLDASRTRATGYELVLFYPS